MTQWQKSSFSGPGDGNECVELALSRTHCCSARAMIRNE
ncbi:DUF397 domain-containing protein [Streptomyces sp. NPDC002685]